MNWHLFFTILCWTLIAWNVSIGIFKIAAWKFAPFSERIFFRDGFEVLREEFRRHVPITLLCALILYCMS